MKQTTDTGEQVVNRGDYAKTQAMRAGLKLVGGGLWLLAACGALATISFGIMTCILLAERSFAAGGECIAMGLGVAGLCAGCGLLARKMAERARALNPRPESGRSDASPALAFDGPKDDAREPMQNPEDLQTQARQAQLSALAEAEAWSRERREKEAALRASRSPALTFLLDRFYPLLVFAAGVTMIGWNHQSILHHHILFYRPIIFGPPALWGGLAALFYPGIPQHGVTRPARVVYLAAMVLSVLSILFLIWLYAVYYRVR